MTTKKEAQEKALEIIGVKSSARIFTRLGQAENFIKEQPIFYDKSKIWWIWNSKEYRWEIGDETDLLNLLNKVMDIDTVTTKARTEIINSLKQVGRNNAPKPTKSTWIQFKDTIVDIETGEEMKATPEYFTTNPIPYPLNKDRFVNTPIMDKIFTEWVGEKYVPLLYQIIAYCLIPSYPIHRIFCFIGSGMNGKSKYLELLRKFIGRDNCCSTELDTLISSRFEITRLHKKLVCQMGETNFNELNKTSILKKLSGGDLIGFEYKNKDPFEEENYAKILIATNNLPNTTDKTDGFYRRWCIVDFPNQFSEKKDILVDIPEEEYECLTVKCLGLLKDLLNKREFEKEGSIEERRKKYEEKSNFLKRFLEQFTIKDESSFITKADFYRKFKEWSKENRHRELSEKSVGMLLTQEEIESSKDYIDWWNNGVSTRKQVRTWRGIKWKEI